MKKYINKSLALCFFILLLVAVVPMYSFTTFATFTVKKNTSSTINQISTDSYISSSPTPDVSFENVSFSENLYFYNDSVITITNANFTRTVFQTIYVYDNVQLILKNITAVVGPDIRVYDNAVVKLINTNFSGNIKIYLNDYSKFYIENCTLDNTEVYSNDFSETYMYNTTIDLIYTYDNSTLYANNITCYDDWYIKENSSISIVNAIIYDDLWLYDTATGYLNDVVFNATGDNIYLYDNITIEVNGSDLQRVYLKGYYVQANISFSNVSYIQSYSEYISFLINVTVDTVNHGFIINGVGNMTSDVIHMQSGTAEPNIKTINSTVTTEANNSYITIDHSTFAFYDSTVSRLHAYDSTISSSGTSFVYFILENSDADIYNSIITGYITSTKSKVILNGSYAYADNMYSSELTAINKTTFSSMYMEDSNATLISSYSLNLEAHDSKIYMENVSETVNTKDYDITDCEMTLKNVTMTQLDLTADPSSLLITNSSISSSSMHLCNTTVQTNVSAFASTIWYVYENVVFKDFNSSFCCINVYGSDSDLNMENDTIIDVFYCTNANSTGTFKNANINKLYTAATGIYELTNNKISLISSTLTWLYYSVYITSGTVNIINHTITGSSTYNVSAEYDSKTTFDHAKILYLYAENCVLNIENMTNSIDIMIVKNSELNIKRATITYLYMEDTQYSIDTCTINLLVLGIDNTIDFFTALDRGMTIIHPNNGTIFNSTILEIYSFGGEAWLTNVTSSSFVISIFSTMHFENNTIGKLSQTFYFTSDGNATNGVPYNYSSHDVIWGPNNVIAKNDTFSVVVYKGKVNITKTDLDCLIVYNDSNVLLNYSDVSHNIIFDGSNFLSNSSEIDYFGIFDSAHATLDNTTTKYYMRFADDSVTTVYDSILDPFDITEHASVTMSNTIIEGVVFNYMINMTDDATLTFEDGIINASSIGYVIFMRNNSKLTFNNVTFDVTFTNYGFEIWDNAQITFLSSNISYVFCDDLGYAFNNSKIVINDTLIFTDYYENDIFLYDYSSLAAYNSNSLVLWGYNYSTIFAQDSNVSSLMALDYSTFTITSSFFYNTSSLIIYALGYIVGSVTNHSISNLFIGVDAEATLRNIYVNSVIIYHQAKLTAYNLTADLIKTYFEFNRTDMGFVNLTDSDINIIYMKTSLYHHGSATINSTTYIYDSAVDFYNHTILHNTTVAKKEYALNIEEFVDVTVENASFTYIDIRLFTDTTNPSVTVSPKSSELEKGMLVPDMIWTLSDDFPDFYELKRNGTVVVTGSYESGDSIKYNISALDAGFWELEFTAYDRAGHSKTVLSNVTIYASEAPVFIYEPSSPYTMTEGSTGNVLNWTATDRFPANYEIYVDGSLVASGNWNSGVEITYNIDHLTEGNYTVRIVVYDQVGNSAESTVNVIVRASLFPPGPGGIPMEYILLVVGIIIVLIVLIIAFKRLKRKKKTL
ncbi:MAG: hypothetical protein ACP6IU_11075 [Candidatus Asgardarchaeia archaeon]